MMDGSKRRRISYLYLESKIREALIALPLSENLLFLERTVCMTE